MIQSYLNQVNKLRKFLTYNPGTQFTPLHFSQAGMVIGYIVRFYYTIVCYFLYSKIGLIIKIGNVEPTQPLWPMKLLYSSICEGNGVLLASTFLPIALVAILFPWSFIFRLLNCLALLIVTSYINSFGSVNHGFHFLLYISVVFLFLPNQAFSNQLLSRRNNLQAVNVFWLVQFLFLFCYSISGLWKVLGFGMDLFTYDTLAMKVLANSVANDGKDEMWLSAVVKFPLFFQASHVFTVFVQLVSVLFFFKPHLIRAYGAVLILFHFGTIFLLRISFPFHIFSWGIFFILTPLAPIKTNLVYMLNSIPVLGLVFRKLFPQNDALKAVSLNKEASIIYDGECPFCSNYVDYMKLRSALGKVHLINARDQDNKLVIEARNKKFDLNDGMVLVIDDVFYYGSDAINMITLLTDSDGIFSSLNHFLFSNKHIATFTYPFYKFGRRLTLMILGRPRIA